MLALRLAAERTTLKVLCIGAHSDDIEIGCAGTLRALRERGHPLEVCWVVLSAPSGDREREARSSAQEWVTPDIGMLDLRLSNYRDAHFPSEFDGLKAYFGALHTSFAPDVVLTHSLDDRHQDHRLVSELTWQTWRNHVVLEYEIPKFEGDLIRPNLYVPLTREICEAKARHLMRHFGSQRSKDWFDPETFHGLMRVRGVECRALEGFAEAFVARKLIL